MRSAISFMLASLAACSALLHAAPSFASDAISQPTDRILALATVVAITLLLLGLGLYVEVASIRPLVRRAGIEAKGREEREENARQEVAQASADLYVALVDLRAQIELLNLARTPAEVAAMVVDRKARHRILSSCPTVGALARDAPRPADPAPAGASASEPPRDTLTMLPPAMPAIPPSPPSEAARRADLGNDDPTSVLSREALEQAMAIESQAPPAPD